MAHDNSEHLRFDSRLASRKGWVSAKDWDDQRNALPDVSDKAELLSDEEPEAEAAVVDSPPSEAVPTSPPSDVAPVLPPSDVAPAAPETPDDV